LQRYHPHLIVFPTSTISQLDLAEEFVLGKNAKETRQEWQEKRRWIKEKIILGARIEKGPRIAKLEERFRWCHCGNCICTVYTVLVIE